MDFSSTSPVGRATRSHQVPPPSGSVAFLLTLLGAHKRISLQCSQPRPETNNTLVFLLAINIIITRVGGREEKFLSIPNEVSALRIRPPPSVPPSSSNGEGDLLRFHKLGSCETTAEVALSPRGSASSSGEATPRGIICCFVSFAAFAIAVLAPPAAHKGAGNNIVALQTIGCCCGRDDGEGGVVDVNDTSMTSSNNSSP